MFCAANFIRTESEFLSYALLNDLIAHLAHYSSAVPISNDVYMCASNNIIKENHTIDECGTKSKSPIWISRTIERIRLRWETNAKIIKLVFELISGEHVCGASGSNSNSHSNNKSSTTIYTTYAHIYVQMQSMDWEKRHDRCIVISYLERSQRFAQLVTIQLQLCTYLWFFFLCGLFCCSFCCCSP